MNLPDWLLDNPYVVEGYRPQESYQGVIKELFSWHNETINAWTMVLAFIVSLILCIKYGMSNTNKTLFFKLSVIAFLLHVCLIVPVSINYHLKAHDSYEARSKAKRIDVLCVFIASILLTIALCLQIVPLPITLILLAICIIQTIKAFSTYDGKSNNKKELATSFTIVILCYLFPMLYGAIVTMNTKIWLCFITAFVALVTAAVIYVYQVPERWSPGTFDYIGSSHQLMHICLIIANIAEFAFIYNVSSS